MAEPLLILGASARAAAASVRRAGLDPFAIDLFADADTEKICPVWTCPPDRYPEGLFELARKAPPGPWMFTGGLENYPELVGALAAERELWGNGPEVLRKVRDPRELTRAVCLWQSEFAVTAFPGEDLPGGIGSWLRKPLRGAGGTGVRHASPEDFAATDGPPSHYLQEFIPGRSGSVVARPTSDRGAEVVGWTHQLVGESWLHARAFQFCGSITCRSAGRTEQHELLVWWLQIYFKPALTGIWGLDFIDRDGPWVVELNPRYTASVEVIEFATGRSFVGRAESSSPTVTPKVGLEDSAYPPKIVGKAIYFAPHRLTFPGSGPWDDSLAHAADVWRRPDYADIPHPGDNIGPGHPVLTILAEAATEADCLRRLQQRAGELDRLFGYVPPEG